MVSGGHFLPIAFAVSTVSAQLMHAAPHYPWHKSYKAVVDQTAAVVEGTAASITETYDEQEGPRTLVTLSPLRVLWGRAIGPSVTLRLFGGRVPGRRGRVDEVHVPTFVQGKRYLVFLSNRDWRLSPVTARQSFLIERVHDKDIVVTADGYAVRGIDNVVGPIRRFPVYRIPDEIDENFVPPIDTDATPKMVTDAYSPAQLVAALKSWAARTGVSVSGTFRDRPYRTAVWRVVKAAGGRKSTGSPAGQPQDFAPKAGQPSAPSREAKPCWEQSQPTDADPKDPSVTCVDGGAR
jgi:hypothetical protein